MESFGVFVTGCMVGIILVYTNVIGFMAGVVTGIFVQTKGPHIGEFIVCSLRSSIVAAKVLVQDASARVDDKVA